MRDELKGIENVRQEFIGTFERFGIKRDYGRDKKTVLLKDIETTGGDRICDHLWFNFTKGFASLPSLENGDRISFEARVKEYKKGYSGYRDDVFKPIEYDYKLSHPSKIKRIEK